MKREFNGSLPDLIQELYSLFHLPGVREVNGLSVTINKFTKDGTVIEDIGIRHKLDSALARLKLQTIETVANTIFPLSLWNPQLDRQILFMRYEAILPKIKSNCRHNRQGTYFERMTNFGGKLNQLDKVIIIYESGITRRSAHQVAIWDPLRDLKKRPYSEFPCLQHLVFQCVKERLIVVGFYATQYLFERAYGNFLGLCNLGKFMAHELKIPLASVKCYVGVELLDIPKTELSQFVDSI